MTLKDYHQCSDKTRTQVFSSTTQCCSEKMVTIVIRKIMKSTDYLNSSASLVVLKECLLNYSSLVPVQTKLPLMIVVQWISKCLFGSIIKKCNDLFQPSNYIVYYRSPIYFVQSYPYEKMTVWSCAWKSSFQKSELFSFHTSRLTGDIPQCSFCFRVFTRISKVWRQSLLFELSSYGFKSQLHAIHVFAPLLKICYLRWPVNVN